MNKERPLDESEVLARAIELKQLPEFKKKDLSELIDQACYYLLLTRDRIPLAENNYRLQKIKEVSDAKTVISPVDAAKFITDQSRRDRALPAFNRFWEFLSKPNDLVSEYEREIACQNLEAAASAGYTQEFCYWLRERFVGWWSLEQRNSQALRASKRYTKKS